MARIRTFAALAVILALGLGLVPLAPSAAQTPSGGPFLIDAASLASLPEVDAV